LIANRTLIHDRVTRQGMSGLAIKWVDAAGYLASFLVFATFCMRTMIALRVAAIGSNVSPAVSVSVLAAGLLY
jgi:hypothetical protein